MPTVQQWGRKESLIWPPRTYLYTLSAFFLSLATVGLFVYVHFQYGLSPLERYCLPYYLRSEMPSLTRHTNAYQLVYVSDGKSQSRPALDPDAEPGRRRNLRARHCRSHFPHRRGSRASACSSASTRAITRTKPFTHGSHTGSMTTFLSTGSSIHNSFLVWRRSYCNSRSPSAKTSSGANNCGMEDG